MSFRNVCSGILFIFLLASCLALFILHSLYFILRNAGDSEKEEIRLRTEDQVFIPAIVICNKLPFSQDGINSVSSSLRQDQPLRYVREWVDPSIREIPDYVSPPAGYFDQGGQTVMQYLNANRNQTIARMQYECQSVINSCSYNGIEMSSFDCCRNVVTHIPSTEGLCWAYHDRTLWQNSTGIMRQFTITFQMTQNSWYSSLFNQHPGIWIYLKESTDDVMRLATELTNPLIMENKRGLRLLVRKERRADTTRGECGQAIGDSERSDEDARHDNQTNLLMCNLMVAAKYCGCHALIAEMLHFDPNLYNAFLGMLSQTPVCNLMQYDACMRRYVDIARQQNWLEPIPRDLQGYDELQNCRNDNHRSCLTVSYPGQEDRFNLPAEFTNTNDYISRLVIQYDSMKTAEVLYSKDPNLYETLSFIGYNIALWFCVAHIIWSIFAFFRDFCCPANKVVPIFRRRKGSLTVVTGGGPAIAQPTSSTEVVIEEPT